MKKSFFLTAALLTAGCTQYWNKPGVGLQETAAALHECRMEANQGGDKVFTAIELESPCMASKGYNLSHTPPKAP